MAQDRPGGEPTEAPTPKRLREARRRGQVARSRELPQVLVLLAMLAALWLTGDALGVEVARFLTQTLDLCAAASRPSPGALLNDALWVLLRTAGPLMGACFLLAVVGGVSQVGGLFTLEPLAPKAERLSPWRGLRRLASRRSLFELAKSIVKAGAVVAIAYHVLGPRLGDLVAATRAGASGALSLGVELGLRLLGETIMVFAGVAILDLLYQRWALRQELRMTRYEVTQELKQTEGDPHHKAQRQRLHRAILEHDMLQEVATADCVVVNPVRLAVALRYDQERHEAPQVVAKGERLVASKIRHLARRHGVPIMRDVPLAQALSRVELGEEIPEELYEAVAEVLRFVYRHGVASPVE